jgi:uncharacterized protein (TIGR02687 family)
LIARRRDGHWANKLLAHSRPTTQALAACYDALEAAAAFFELKAKFQAGFSFANAEAGLVGYQTELFRFDQLYRQFNHAADAVEPMGWALLHELRERIENGYSGWFVPQLGSAWSKVLEGEGGLLSRWKIPSWENQQDFFTRHVKVHLDSGIKRVFVVISDAFRYEAAEELVRDINGKSRFKAVLTPMLGVLPSYTALGMAALLPHDTLAYKQNSTSTWRPMARWFRPSSNAVTSLAKYQGVAIKADDLLALGKDKGREFVRDQQVIYIYHDKIDLLGDKQGSEQETFDAVAQTLNELNQLASFIVNSLNASLVLMTADHGFLYQDAPLDDADKSTLGDKPDGTLKAKKRYLLGQGIGESSKAWCGNTHVTAGTTPGDGSMDFWVPQRCSPLPFCRWRPFRPWQRHAAGDRDPGDHPARDRERVCQNAGGRIQSAWFVEQGGDQQAAFRIHPDEPVSERVLARSVLVSLRDGETLISDELSVTFDSTSGLMDERKRSVMLTVKSGSYDKSQRPFPDCPRCPDQGGSCPHSAQGGSGLRQRFLRTDS